jgi:plasmid stabilization system protein ParE
VTRRIRLHLAAQQELEEAASYYDLEGPGLGSAFLADFEQAGEQIRVLPESAPLLRQHARRKLMARFPYAVIYSVVAQDVLVLAVAHLRRRPFYWQDRL